MDPASKVSRILYCLNVPESTKLVFFLQIFDFLYLGSEWNSGNLEELNGNGITHILNVTREIDNFFPAGFQYLNIREYDEETTDLLKYWNKTFNFINDAKEV